MAKIPLRAYIKEIEAQIDRGEIDQAIAHTKNIIRAYPKQIDSYRLLGKAYLESQRYSEALDILQRLLMVIPDDFVSHVGVSIIREDEGNLDAAIWHMERAYEVEPFNPAVQDELRRLYGRRDGVEPPKIRLTRGALVRMYMRGELYPQAIAEIRAVLVDDPQRHDLLVLLARLYSLSQQKIEAIEVCSSLINKLPYCFEANQILAEILPGTSRAEDAKKFQQRVIALDPYAAFISPSAPTSRQAPDQAVMVEQYEWSPEADELQSPEWVKTIGIAWDETQEEELPDWIDSLSALPAETEMPVRDTQLGKETPAQAHLDPSTERIQDDDELVPDWMKEAGWAVSEKPTDEALAFEEENEEILPADIPSWLQSKAPEMPMDEETSEAARTDWLEDILEKPGIYKQNSDSLPEEEQAVAKSRITTDEAIELIEDVHTQEYAPEEPLPVVTAEQDSSDETATPDWLLALEEEARAPQSEQQASIPTWLTAETTGDVPSPAEDQSVPDWLKHFGEDISVSPDIETIEIAETAESSIETSAWLPEEETISMDWLSSLSAIQAKDEQAIADEAISEQETQPRQADIESETSPVSDEERQPIFDVSKRLIHQVTGQPLPDWLEDFADEKEDFSEPFATRQPAWEGESAKSEGTLEEATELDAFQEAPGSESEAAQQPQAAFEETPMDETRVGFGNTEPTQADESPFETPQMIEDWNTVAGESLIETHPTEVIDETTPELESTIDVSPNKAKTGMEAEPPIETLDIDEAMAWLESLAARQGADEATLITKPEDRTETPPDWVLEDLELMTDSPQEAEPVEEAVQRLPDDSALVSDEAIQIDSLSEQEPESETQAEIIELMEQEKTAFVDAVPQSENEFDSAFAWLESLAARQGAEEGTLITQPEERPKSRPEWLTEQPEAISEPEKADAYPSTSQASEESPDWLQTLETGEEAADEFTSVLSDTEQAVGNHEAPIETVEPLPSWLQEAEVEPERPAPTVSEAAVLDWLESMDVMDEETAPLLPFESEAELEPEEFRSAWKPELVVQPELENEEERQKTSSPLGDLRTTLEHGDIEEALEGYNHLIQAEENLPEVIKALRDALYRYPVDIDIWQSLGDAYSRNNQLQEAIEAYTQAEELLR